MALNRADWPQYEVAARECWVVGLDVGQSVDPSALCALQHVVTPGEWVCDDVNRCWRQGKIERFLVRHLERLPLQMPYPEQISHVANLLSRDPLKRAKFALDYTGCGRPVADCFSRAGLKPYKILITAGNECTSNGMQFNVPKQYLCSALESRLHSQELKIAPELMEAPVLKDELRDFTRKVSESERATFNARAGRHDDLILSICIALHIACNRSRSSRVPLGL